MTSSPVPGHGSWGQDSWKESRPSRVPKVQIWMLSNEWLSRYEVLKNLHIKLCLSVMGTQTQTRMTTRAKNGTNVFLECYLQFKKWVKNSRVPHNISFIWKEIWKETSPYKNWQELSLEGRRRVRKFHSHDHTAFVPLAREYSVVGALH